MDRRGPEWLFGQRGRDAAVRWFKRKGYFVLPVDLISNGGAPVIEALRRSIVMPDLLVTRHRPVWVDVKTKSRVHRYSKGTMQQHGIDLDHWQAYMEVQHLTRIPGALAIVEADTGKLGFGFLDDLADHARPFTGPRARQIYHGSEMMFIARDQLRFYQLSDPQALHGLPSPVDHPWYSARPDDASQGFFKWG